MIMSEPKTQFERFNSRVRNHPMVTALMILGTVVISLSTFTDAAKNLWGLVVTEARPDMNGPWQSEVTYDWGNAKYSETFTFGGDGEEVHGTASFLGVNRGILDGRVKDGSLQFITKTGEMVGDERKDVVHRYRGKVLRDEIKFLMQTEGGSSEHLPIEFTARKAPNASNDANPTASTAPR